MWRILWLKCYWIQWRRFGWRHWFKVRYSVPPQPHPLLEFQNPVVWLEVKCATSEAARVVENYWSSLSAHERSGLGLIAVTV